MSNRNDDSEEIRTMLASRIEGVLDDLAPGWVNSHGRGYPVPKSAKDLGSFQVNLTGSKRGSWYRFSQDVGGGTVELCSYLLTGRKDAYREAFRWARGFLGLSSELESGTDRDDRARRRAQLHAESEQRRVLDEERERQRKAFRTSTALEVWEEGQPLAGSHAEAYLVNRGIPPVSEWPWKADDSLRFHPGLDYEIDHNVGRFPALIAKVVDIAGQILAVWQIYLDPKRPTKANVLTPKVGRGPAKGGAVRIGGSSPRIGANEGVESALSTWALHGYRFPVWAMLSTSGLQAFEPPLFVERVDIFPDGDLAVLDRFTGRLRDPPGIVAARELASRLRPTGIRAIVNEPALNGDNNDILMIWRKRERAGATEGSAY